MAGSLQDLKNAAVSLPGAQRVELAEFLLSSLDEKMTPEVRGEWIALAESRMSEIKPGRVKGVSADEVHRTLLQLTK
jgi:hypothetical protein